MTDKEQIIINGINIFKTLNDWADFLSKEWCSDERPIVELVKIYISDINGQLARSNQIIEQQQKTLDELVGDVSTWEDFTEEESELAKDSSIADLIMLLREKDERIIELTKGNKESQKWIKEWNKYVGLVRSWITQAAKDLGLDTEHSFGVEHFTFAVRCLKEEHEKLKQEYNDLLEQHRELDDRANRMTEEKYNLCRDCEELKNTLKKLTRGVVLPAIPEPEVINLTARYRKALEEIEEFCITYSDNHDAYETVYKYILNIINRAKGEE